MTRSQYIRALIVADCERKAPLPDGDLQALIQATAALSAKPASEELNDVRALLKQYVKANGASWRL